MLTGVLASPRWRREGLARLREQPRSRWLVLAGLGIPRRLRGARRRVPAGLLRPSTCAPTPKSRSGSSLPARSGRTSRGATGAGPQSPSRCSSPTSKRSAGTRPRSVPAAREGHALKRWRRPCRKAPEPRRVAAILEWEQANAVLARNGRASRATGRHPSTASCGSSRPPGPASSARRGRSTRTRTSPRFRTDSPVIPALRRAADRRQPRGRRAAHRARRGCPSLPPARPSARLSGQPRGGTFPTSARTRCWSRGARRAGGASGADRAAVRPSAAPVAADGSKSAPIKYADAHRSRRRLVVLSSRGSPGLARDAGRSARAAPACRFPLHLAMPVQSRAAHAAPRLPSRSVAPRIAIASSRRRCSVLLCKLTMQRVDTRSPGSYFPAALTMDYLSPYIPIPRAAAVTGVLCTAIGVLATVLRAEADHRHQGDRLFECGSPTTGRPARAPLGEVLPGRAPSHRLRIESVFIYRGERSCATCTAKVWAGSRTSRCCRSCDVGARVGLRLAQGRPGVQPVSDHRLPCSSRRQTSGVAPVSAATRNTIPVLATASRRASGFSREPLHALGWARKNSIFQYPFVTACLRKWNT